MNYFLAIHTRLIMGRVRSDAHLNVCLQFLPASCDLAFPDRSSKEFEGKSGSSKTFGFCPNKLSLDPGVPRVFHHLLYPFKEQQLG